MTTITLDTNMLSDDELIAVGRSDGYRFAFASVTDRELEAAGQTIGAGLRRRAAR